VSARRRTDRDQRRRHLGQNFLGGAVAERLVGEADFKPGDLVLEIGAGRGAITFALARRPVRVLAIEADPVWARRLRAEAASLGNIRVIAGAFHAVALPSEPFRVFANPPFGQTTEILRRLLDDPCVPLTRADLIVQWEVAQKRAAAPPATLLSAIWAPWWEMRLAAHIPAAAFRPVPRVDAGLLTITRRDPPVLPPAMAPAYARFVRAGWPFRAS
jgi:23S rRNA (adenine-N6)-dimethyltransferase